MALIEFVAESKTPDAGPRRHDGGRAADGRAQALGVQTTQNDDIIADALIEHMVKSGVKTLAFIGL